MTGIELEVYRKEALDASTIRLSLRPAPLDGGNTPWGDHQVDVPVENEPVMFARYTTIYTPVEGVD